MTIYGIGAHYSSSKKDVTQDFVKNGLACIGYGERRAPGLHRLLKQIKVGDIIYIKSHPPNLGLYIKAVGVVKSDNIVEETNLGKGCIKVRWIWTGEEKIGKIDDKYNVRNITLYEEYNPDVQKKVLDLLFQNL